LIRVKKKKAILENAPKYAPTRAMLPLRPISVTSQHRQVLRVSVGFVLCRQIGLKSECKINGA
jgi:hypothetical protein